MDEEVNKISISQDLGVTKDSSDFLRKLVSPVIVRNPKGPTNGDYELSGSTLPRIEWFRVQWRILDQLRRRTLRFFPSAHVPSKAKPHKPQLVVHPTAWRQRILQVVSNLKLLKSGTKFEVRVHYGFGGGSYCNGIVNLYELKSGKHAAFGDGLTGLISHEVGHAHHESKFLPWLFQRSFMSVQKPRIPLKSHFVGQKDNRIRHIGYGLNVVFKKAPYYDFWHENYAEAFEMVTLSATQRKRSGSKFITIRSYRSMSPISRKKYQPWFDRKIQRLEHTARLIILCRKQTGHRLSAAARREFEIAMLKNRKRIAKRSFVQAQ